MINTEAHPENRKAAGVFVSCCFCQGFSFGGKVAKAGVWRKKWEGHLIDF